MKKDKLFDSLMTNAFDFLSKSIEEFDENPKYSLVNFYSAIELLLKARLLYDHWSMVVAKGSDLNYDSFIKGDFQSVTSKDSIYRLRNALKVNISKEFEFSIDSLRKHRNKIVHFFHEAHTKSSKDKLKTAIAKEQLTCWYHLYLFITKDCNGVFDTWCKNAATINKKLKKHREYLSVIFDKSTNAINDLKNKGIQFKKCPSCNFASLPKIYSLNTIENNKCMVCDYVETVIQVKCPDCGNNVNFINEGFSFCKKCKRHFEPENLADILTPIAYDFDEIDGERLGNCSECDSHSSVVELEDGKYLCSVCFETFDQLYVCTWCNELNTSDMSFSSISGCNFCDGSGNYD